MYGPVPTASPRRRAVRVGVVVGRVILTAIPVMSVGMLGWIPMLYLAIVYRRGRDWLIFSAVAVAAIGGVALVGTAHGEDGSQTTAGVLLLLGMVVFTPAYFLAVELRPRDTPQPQTVLTVPLALPQPQYPPLGVPRHDRIEQVRSGLDELSAYLKQEDRS